MGPWRMAGEGWTRWPGPVGPGRAPREPTLVFTSLSTWAAPRAREDSGPTASLGCRWAGVWGCHSGAELQKRGAAFLPCSHRAAPPQSLGEEVGPASAKAAFHACERSVAAGEGTRFLLSKISAKPVRLQG